MLKEQKKVSERFTTQLRTAAELAHKLNGILDVDELLSETVSQLQGSFELYHVHIYLLSKDSPRRLVMHTGSGEVGQALRERQHAIPYDHEQSLVARAAQTGEVVLVNDVRKESAFMPNPLLPDTRSELAVPLLTGERLLGVLDVQDDVLERFSESDVDILSIVAGQIAIALENARLFEQKEEALEVTRLRLRVNEAFIGLQSEQDVLDTIMEEATFHKDARVMLLLLESEGEEKKFVLVDGQSLESGLPILPKGLSFPFKAYPLSQYTTTEALFVTNNILRDERIDEASRAVMERTGTVSLLTAQLAVGKQLYGLLSIASKEADYFDEHKIRLHQILAERGGLALHEARLRAATEQARAEAEHERNLLNSILSTLPVGVYVSDKQGKAMRSNQMARLLLGQNISESPEKELTELYHVVYSESGLSYPEEKLPLIKSLQDGLPHSRDDMAVIQPDGTKIDLLVNSGALVDQKGEIIGATVAFSDISQRRRTEEALARANRELLKARDELELRVEARTAELAQLNKDLENLLYIISHDLKEPLRAIQNFSRLVIRRYAKKLDAKGQDYLARVDRAGARLRTLIDDILTLSRAQRMELRLEAIASEQMVRDVCERLEAQIQESEARIELAPDLPELHVNRTWATQAIYNLISNALKYRRIEETTGKALPPELSITRYEGVSGHGLAIKDRGPGVPEEYAERIFQLFQRAVGREIEGTGAGLAIVRQIALRHGGHAWVEARSGGGSEFIITFGRAKASSPGDEK